MMRSVGWVVALLAVAGCVDVAGGERASYSSPCVTVFGDLLLCGRETGGADPAGVPEPGADTFTCADACQLLCECFLCEDPGDVAECTLGCENDPGSQAILACIEIYRCDIEACVGDS